ncbi:MerR family transcriptional regulator [Citricoccus zhacaiensis]
MSGVWSTREVAELAGTTVNAVRFYHRSGLLEEPERKSNGYKQYRARHLVRLLRIRRLRDLGVPLSRIGAVDAEGDEAMEALRVLDAELPEDADEACRQDLAERLAPVLATHLTDYPWLSDPGPHLSRAQSVTDRTMAEAMAELYTAAQRDVLRRVMLIVGAEKAQNDADPRPGR